MHIDQSNPFYHFLNPAKIDLNSESIDAVRNYSLFFSQQHKIDSKFNILWFNAFHFTVEPQNINETIQRVTSTISSPDQIIGLWAVGSHMNLCDIVVEKINKFSSSIKNPIIYFTGALPTQPQKVDGSLRFTIAPLMYFEFESCNHWNHRPYLEPPNIEKNPLVKSKKFTFMGTKDYPNRKFLLSHIINNNLIDQGYVSYKQKDYGDLGYGFASTEIEFITKTANSIDHYLPLPELDDSVEWVCMPKECLLNSYVNMVTDTVYATEPGFTFISEKVFNAIAHWQMFIMMAPPYTLKYLREQGYQTFSPYIDETYDTIENNYDRLLAVTKSFIDFVSQPIEVLEQIYHECLPIVKHNQQRLINNNNCVQLNKELQRAINEKI